MKKITNYINGEYCQPLSGRFLPNYNPATGEIYSEVADSDERDVDLAVEKARAAFPLWSGTKASERSRILLDIAKRITLKLEELALAESIDNGKPISLARSVDIPRSAQNFEFFAFEILNFKGEEFAPLGKGRNYTTYSPLGVVGCISPWNLPLYLFTWKIAPALAAGNTVVAKPSEITPMSAFLLAQICQEAGLPPGVLNIVHGLGIKVGSRISDHPDIKAVSFTGSTKTGKEIAKVAAPHFKKLSLEMGGKNPNIIFADCDFELALETTLRSSFANQGQICLCGSRIFVEKSIYENFKSRLVKKVELLKMGNPLEESTEQGALVSLEHLEKIQACVELAKAEGGKILIGGERAELGGENKNGYFYRPTLIENLSPFCKTNQEEIFGPVATIMPFEKIEDVVEWANGTRYGLAGTIWSKNIEKAKKVAAEINSGILWINCWMVRDLRTPFGGMKDSGMGREGGLYALKFFSEVKNICIGE